VQYSVSGIIYQVLFLQVTGQNKVYLIPIKVKDPKKVGSTVRNWGEIKRFHKKVGKQDKSGDLT
jgi:hypothetical protein